MSNPFAPPGPQPQQQPSQQPPHPQPHQDPFAQPAQGHYSSPGQGPFAQPAQGQFAPPVPQATYGGSGPMWAPQPFAHAPKGGNGLAITAIVMSGLALLSVLAMATFIFVGSGGSGGWVLSGKVTVVDKGVADLALQDALMAAIEDDGGTVDDLECPLRSQVGQGLVTVCHGSVDGWDWTGVVVFEDDDGTFIVTEY